ncbi:GNAT family N-acetyltransferase [Kordiimonas aestuarii]|uniref:GNAT family N-acetyltransferase n=1 Tax=Kordiimonas aestuarii TaxID=1005925 RepID=UPI0021D26156|nr:N-acetyltransferase [Kordiimonas aestuarii]
MINFDQERPFDKAQVEALLDVAFGPDRFSKSSYSLRENVGPVASLSRVARVDGRIVGTVRFWPILVRDLIRGSDMEALLLGPLAVAPSVQSHGVGAELMQRSLAAAAEAGHRRVLLVGDIAYYGRFGFESVLPNYITMPGGRDARRLLVRQSAAMKSLPAVGKILPAIPERIAPAAVLAGGYGRGLPVAAA